jgi:mannose-6-phosphate isomerase-like protein (cupin superfamily)
VSKKPTIRFPVGVPFYVAEVRVVYRARADETGAMMVFEAWVPPGGGPPPLHTHEAAEYFYTLEGEITYFRDDGDDGVKTITGGPGTVGYVPSQQPHTYRNLSLEPGRFMGVCVPGQDQEGFFDDAGVPVGSDGGPAEQVDNATMMEISERWGLKWLELPPGTTMG